MSIKRTQWPFQGFTLIEVLVTVVVLAIAATAIMNVFIASVKTSADPLLQQQAVAIANAYLEEIQGQAFADPVVAETGGAEAGETRASYNDVRDYDGLSDSGARDQNGNLISGLENYAVTVSVTGHSLTAAATINAANALRIDITVTHPAIGTILVSGYRVNF